MQKKITQHGSGLPKQTWIAYQIIFPFSLYRDDFDPRVTNEFSSAAFRIGHTMIPDVIRLFNKKYINRQVDLSDVFNNPSIPRYEG